MGGGFPPLDEGVLALIRSLKFQVRGADLTKDTLGPRMSMDGMTTVRFLRRAGRKTLNWIALIDKSGRALFLFRIFMFVMLTPLSG